MPEFEDLIPQKQGLSFEDLIPKERPEETEEDPALGPVGLEIDVDELIDLGVIKPENIQGRTLGEIAADPEIQRTVLELGGMTIGSMVAPQITGPMAVARFPKAIKAAKQILGAGAGGAAGSLAAEVRDPTEKPLETAKEVAKEGVAGETIGLGVVAAGKKAIGPFKDRLIEGAEEAYKLITERGGVITPGKLSKSRVLDTLEGVTESSLLGGGRITEVEEQTVDMARGLADDYFDSFISKSSREETDLLIQDAVKEGGEALKAIGGAFYRRVDALTDTVLVDISKTKKLAQNLLARSEKGLGSEDVRKIANNIAQKKNVISFDEAQIIRSDLLAVSRAKEKGLVAGKGEAFAKHLAKNVDDQMTTAAKGLDKEGLEAWRTANEFWKTKSKMFNNRIIKNIAVKEPERLFETSFKHNNPRTIRNIKNVIGDERVWNNIKGQWIRDVTEKSSNELGELSGNKLMKLIKKWQDGGSLKEILNPEQAINLKKIARTLQIVEAPAAKEKIGSVAIQLLQVGAAGTVLSLNENKREGQAAAAAIIFGPAVMASLLTRKSFSKWLTVGLKAPAGSAEGAKALSKLAVMIENEKEEE